MRQAFELVKDAAAKNAIIEAWRIEVQIQRRYQKNKIPFQTIQPNRTPDWLAKS